MKTVLLLIHDDAGEEARLQAALDLTRAVGRHLTCLITVLMGADYVMAKAEQALVRYARAGAAANRARTEARLARELVAWSWTDATGNIAVLLKHQSALADIIVLNTGFTARDVMDMRTIVSDVVMRSGKPILAAPPSCHGLDTNGHALIAWNSASPVVATLRAVTPLLLLAQGVTIFEIDKSALSAEECANSLSQYGILARVDREDSPDMSVDVVLLATCRNRRPAYCAMGAYGHSRLRETLFGGVTRRMLAESPVPLILGH